MADGPSKTRIDRAGDALRCCLRGDPGYDIDGDRVQEALHMVSDYRATFFRPLAHVAVRVERCVAEVTRGRESSEPGLRPKRLSRIAWKLYRQSTRLTQMEDIGGCRVVLHDLDELRQVQASLLELWPDAHVDDYVTRSKSTGYRAVHLVVVRDERKIEVQLRTEKQNEWADAVERTGDRLKEQLKDGEGPADLLEYFRVAADKLAVEEEGGTPGDDLEQALAALREKVRPYFKRQG